MIPSIRLALAVTALAVAASGPALGAADEIVALRARVPGERSALVALSGIDGAGKGYIARALSARLEGRGLRVATIGIDPWLDLPSRRFDPREPARGFYERAIRFEEMFRALVLPLRASRSIRLEADLAEETATAFHRSTYAFDDVDVIVLEGMYLLKRAWRDSYDLAVWIDCSFETALERAIARGQEGLPPDETVRAYWTIYFPAQRIHFAEDRPRAAADLILVNDPRRGAAVSEGE